MKKKFLFFLIWLAALGLVIFFLKIQETVIRDADLEPVAKVDKFKGNVQIRPESSVIWTDMDIDQYLYEDDYISTGNNSNAIIKIISGVSIDLGSNTQIKLQASEDTDSKFEVELLSGQLKTLNDLGSLKNENEKKVQDTSSSPVNKLPEGYQHLTIRSGDKKFKLAEKNAEIKLFKEKDSDKLNVLAASGKILVKKIDSTDKAGAGSLKNEKNMKLLPAADLTKTVSNKKNGTAQDTREGTYSEDSFDEVIDIKKDKEELKRKKDPDSSKFSLIKKKLGSKDIKTDMDIESDSFSLRGNQEVANSDKKDSAELNDDQRESDENASKEENEVVKEKTVFESKHNYTLSPTTPSMDEMESKYGQYIPDIISPNEDSIIWSLYDIEKLTGESITLLLKQKYSSFEDVIIIPIIGIIKPGTLQSLNNVRVTGSGAANMESQKIEIKLNNILTEGLYTKKDSFFKEYTILIKPGLQIFNNKTKLTTNIFGKILPIKMASIENPKDGALTVFFDSLSFDKTSSKLTRTEKKNFTSGKWIELDSSKNLAKIFPFIGDLNNFGIKLQPLSKNNGIFFIKKGSIIARVEGSEKISQILVIQDILKADLSFKGNYSALINDLNEFLRRKSGFSDNTRLYLYTNKQLIGINMGLIRKNKTAKDFVSDQSKTFFSEEIKTFSH
ncbi:MAG: hypothetical protein HQK54_10505 [Oligoflexales bacterium]|nr:hypothetical protein [Oligoflexales bacterium]